MPLSDIMPNNKFITKMTEKRRRRKAIKSMKATDCPIIEEHTESSASASDKRVRFAREAFGRDSITVHELPPVLVGETSDRHHQQQEGSVKDQLWYNKTELNDQFLKDLAAHVQEQVQRAQLEYQNSTGSYTSNGASSSRGLEFHFAHNQRRKEKAEAYVRHIVEKANELRREYGLKSSNTGHRKWDRRVAVRSIRANPMAAQHYADQIQELCSQYTHMAREFALGVAAEDAAEARAIYQEDATEELESDSEASTSSDKTTSSSDFIPTSHQSLRKQPVCYNAKSA